MTEWNANEYSQRSALQKWLADERLSALDLTQVEVTSSVAIGARLDSTRP